MDASGCREAVTAPRRLPDRMDLHGYSSSYHARTVWPQQILQLPRLLKLWAWGGCRHYSLDYSEVPTKAGISNPLDYHVLPFPPHPHPPPLLPEYGQQEDQVCAGRRGWQDSHSFPAPGGKNRGHSSDDLLLSALVCFVLPLLKRNFHIFQIAIVSRCC